MPDRGDRRDGVPMDPGSDTDRRTFLKVAGLAGIEEFSMRK